MRYLLLLAFIPIIAFADKCEFHASLAEQIMKSRQAGVPMTNTMKIAYETEQPLQDLVIMYTRDAYKRPGFNYEEFQQREITDFTDRAYMECLDVVMEAEK